MGSSFLTAINLGLALYCVINFLKMIVQFGLPNHPARFTLYVVTLCVAAYFVLKTVADFQILDPFQYMRYRTIPVVAGSLGLLFQVITTVGSYGLLQQKIISRIPLIMALIFFAFFPTEADLFLKLSILAIVLFLSASVGRARYQKRTLFKMTLFLVIYWIFTSMNYYWLYILGELFLFPALFYLFIFQQSYGVSALIAKFMSKDTGVHS